MKRIYRKYKCPETGCDYRAAAAGPLNLHRFQAHSKRTRLAKPASLKEDAALTGAATALAKALGEYTDAIVRSKLRLLIET